MPRPIKNRLLVEGDEDKRVIPELVEAQGIPWGEARKDAIVDIESYDGVENLLSQRVISTELKASGLDALGIMVDANDSPGGRWQRIREVCLPSIPDLPEELPEEGLVHHCQSGITVGVWLMPDNRRRGMLETFLPVLVPEPQKRLWEWTDQLSTRARELGAPYKEGHRDKARIHTWLALQDPPGRPLHNAIMESIFVPTGPGADSFVSWFCRLFELRIKL